jgi:hypothetical protein
MVLDTLRLWQPNLEQAMQITLESPGGPRHSAPPWNPLKTRVAVVTMTSIHDAIAEYSLLAPAVINHCATCHPSVLHGLIKPIDELLFLAMRGTRPDDLESIAAELEERQTALHKISVHLDCSFLRTLARQLERIYGAFDMVIDKRPFIESAIGEYS